LIEKLKNKINFFSEFSRLKKAIPKEWYVQLSEEKSVKTTINIAGIEIADQLAKEAAKESMSLNEQYNVITMSDVKQAVKTCSHLRQNSAYLWVWHI
jgi:GTP:adenosylcobinamide-phosphate guanylyltransferase